MLEVLRQGIPHGQVLLVFEEPLPDIVLLQHRDVRNPLHPDWGRPRPEVEHPLERSEFSVNRGRSRPLP
jgi:hypothetical protein